MDPGVFQRPPVSPAADAEIRLELEAALAGIEFRTSHRGQMLLRYLVEHALQRGLDPLKERTIGVELFHRHLSYDTGQDAIVRVAASDVRKRLVAYYKRRDAAGTSSRLRISLPPGSYVPEFEIRETAAACSGSGNPFPEPDAGTPPRRWAMWGALAGLAALCLFLAFQNANLRATTHSARLAMLPWSQIAMPGATVALVTADTNFYLYESLIHSALPLQAYIGQNWLEDFGARIPSLSGLRRLPVTSCGDAAVAAMIGGALRSGNCSIAVRSGRLVQMHDFKSDRPIILLGSAYSNPWVSLFSDRLNFHIDYDPSSGKQVCRNSNPRAGELREYVGTAGTPAPGIGYATISLVRNLSRQGFVLIVAGTNMEGTEAAAELATDLPRLTGALRSRGINPFAKVEQLELLIRLAHLESEPGRSEIIAHRVVR